MAASQRKGDPRVADELAPMREAIAKTTDFNRLQKLRQGYATVATKLGEGDRRGAEELEALRDAVRNASDPNQLQAFAEGYASVADKVQSAILPEKDVALLLARMPSLRTASRAGHSQRLSTRPYGQEGQRFPGIK